MLRNRLLTFTMVIFGLACGSSPEDDFTGPVVAFADPVASFFEDTPLSEFTIHLLVTDDAGVAKVGVRVGPFGVDPEVNPVGRTVYLPAGTDFSVGFPWAEVVPGFTHGTAAKKITVTAEAVDIFGNVSVLTSREHTLRSRQLWTVSPAGETMQSPVFVDAAGFVWVGTIQSGVNGRLLRFDKAGALNCATVAALLPYPGELVNGVAEAVGAGPNGENVIAFGTSMGLRAVVREGCVALWNALDGFESPGHPVYDSDGLRFVALNKTSPGRIVTLNPATGTPSPTTVADADSFEVSALITPAGNIYAGSLTSGMFRFDSLMMSLPTVPTMSAAIKADPVRDGDRVYFGAGDSIYVVDDATDAVSSFPVSGDPIESRPAIALDGTILTTTVAAQQLFALDPVDGAVLWQTPVGSVGLGGAAVSNDGGRWTAYIGNAEGIIHAINQDGTIAWKLDTTTTPQSIVNYGVVYVDPMTNDVTLYINTLEFIYAIDLGTPAAL